MLNIFYNRQGIKYITIHSRGFWTVFFPISNSINIYTIAESSVVCVWYVCVCQVGVCHVGDCVSVYGIATESRLQNTPVTSHGHGKLFRLCDTSLAIEGNGSS